MIHELSKLPNNQILATRYSGPLESRGLSARIPHQFVVRLDASSQPASCRIPSFRVRNRPAARTYSLGTFRHSLGPIFGL